MDNIRLTDYSEIEAEISAPPGVLKFFNETGLDMCGMISFDVLTRLKNGLYDNQALMWDLQNNLNLDIDTWRDLLYSLIHCERLYSSDSANSFLDDKNDMLAASNMMKDGLKLLLDGAKAARIASHKHAIRPPGINLLNAIETGVNNRLEIERNLVDTSKNYTLDLNPDNHQNIYVSEILESAVSYDLMVKPGFLKNALAFNNHTPCYDEDIISALYDDICRYSIEWDSSLDIINRKSKAPPKAVFIAGFWNALKEIPARPINPGSKKPCLILISDSHIQALGNIILSLADKDKISYQNIKNSIGIAKHRQAKHFNSVGFCPLS